MNPFELRSVLLARHAQHVVLIHFPIALFITGVLFDVLSRGHRTSLLGNAAYVNLTAAAITVFPAVITGLLAWQFVLDGRKPKGLLLLHLLAAWSSVLFIVASWLLHRHGRRAEAAPPAYRFALEFLGVAFVVITAHLGGFLSGVNS